MRICAVVSWLAACMIVKGIDYLPAYVYSSLLLYSQPSGRIKQVASGKVEPSLKTFNIATTPARWCFAENDESVL